MAQASRKVIESEVDLAATLPSPRFDEQAAQQARPVVPLSGEAVTENLGVTVNREAQRTALPSRMGTWLLAAVVGLIVGAGAMAVSFAAYRRNQVKPPQALVPAASATRVDINTDFKLRPSSRVNSADAKVASVAPASNDTANTPAATPAAVAVPKAKKRSQPAATTPPESASSETDSSGRPKPRLVDSYVVPRRRP